MKTIKRLTLCAFFALCSLYASAHDFEIDGIYYKITSDGTANSPTVEVTYYGSNIYSGVYVGDIDIPSIVEYDGVNYDVTTIGNYAFSDSYSLSSVIIPNSVTSIGDFAFDHCLYMTSVIIPNSVTSIGMGAFWMDLSLTSINIPKNVKKIGEEAFSYCQCITSIIIPDGVTTIEYGTFERCYALASVSIPNSVTKICEYAFYFCESLETIDIPNSVLTIDEQAFGWCTGLKQIFSYNNEPPVCGSDVFYSLNKKSCNLYVPIGSKEKYSTADQWKDFTTIYDELNGIESVSADDAEVASYYTIDGKSVENPQRGVNIVKFSDGTTKKILVK